MQNDVIVNYENKPCYKIIFRDNFAELAENLIEISSNKSRKICIVSDDIVGKLYLGEAKNEISQKFNQVYTFIFDNGEKSKSLSTVELLYEYLINEHFDRTDILIALGGGVVGDLTGFCAATYLRGIDFVQVPTTLLSQVDSSIGGKTGVDFKHYKNMVGAFYMPKLVYINVSTLKSLPDVQFASGMGEVIKHGLIRDKEYFSWLKDNISSVKSRSGDALMQTVYKSCCIKKAVVEEDPKEQGLRAILNFGHTIGHAIEKLSDFKLYHGQCVAIGTMAAANMSNKLSLISDDDVKLIRDTLTSYDLPADLPTAGIDIDASDILYATKNDKKMVGHKVKFILLDGIGNAIINSDLDEAFILEGIRSIL